MIKFKYLRPVAASGILAAALMLPAPGVAAAKDKDKSNQSAYQNSDLAHVSREVRHELLMLPYYNIFDSLSFKVDPGGVVTLMGQVTNPTLKSDAYNVVKRVEGVTAVNNQIEVLPLSPMDNQIRRAVARAIYANPTLSDRYGFQAMPSIHILVKNGHVVLDGVVSSEADKNIAGIQANSVPGVFSVTNNLRVEK
jgi:hyperosmotically inducible periplasmic protein